MVWIFANTMIKSKATEKNSKTCTKNGKKILYDDKKRLRNGCLFCGIVIILIGTVILFSVMDDGEWAENSSTRKRILLIACCLFITSTGLCLYVMRADRKDRQEELELLIIEKPPSYDSVVREEPPPAYIAVVRSIHIIQQETTG